MPVRAFGAIAVLMTVAVLLLRLNFQTAWDEIALGESAMQRGDAAEATIHFSSAIAMEPHSWQVRLRIGTDYADDFCGQSELTPESQALSDAAIRHLSVVLNLDNKNAKAYLKLGEVFRWKARWDEARVFYLQAAAMDPSDPLPYFRVATLDWQKAWRRRVDSLVSRGLGQKDSIANMADCRRLALENAPTLENGIEMLRHALNLAPVEIDPLAYMSVLYREKAQLFCEDPGARADALQTSEKWRHAYCEKRRLRPLVSSEYLYDGQAGLLAPCEAEPGR